VRENALYLESEEQADVAPQQERTTLSVSIWRMRRAFPAPSAARMAISFLT